ncbi:putative quinol monooxygenase [Novosphingobium malaysiense]|uniref:ABM domain-containing protein n=1 Tax=Novosphingobium malaysiense TaxID=1348853 RepID=A0A0B1ZGS0_9SPHN|nr:putative quinol monooxygenase [Novosphingobium malaysiense]KHK90296.1 hypothetical protein LK12_16890 [Novosphingobium malaysiense]
MAIGGFVRLIPKAGKEDELMERLLDVAEDVRKEPGNLVTYVLRDKENRRDVLMFELFADQAAIVAHREAEHSIKKGPAIHAILETPMQVQWLETP